LAAPTTLPPNTRTILETLGNTPLGEAAQMAREAKNRLSRHKSVIKRWQTRLAYVAGLLIIVVLSLTWDKLLVFIKRLPHGLQNSPQTEISVMTQPLAGLVLDENRKPLAGVQIELPEVQLSAITAQDGTFAFQVKDVQQSQVRLTARKDGYTTEHAHPALGHTSFALIMRKTP
jgi:hypothetical protein